jgi:hypothetical protein
MASLNQKQTTFKVPLAVPTPFASNSLVAYTVNDSTGFPSVCFSSIVNQSDPVLTIEGAELFIGFDKDTQEAILLANEGALYRTFNASR